MKRLLAIALASPLGLGCAQLQHIADQNNPRPGQRAPESNPSVLDQIKGRAGELTQGKHCTPEETARFEMTQDNEYWFGRSVADRLLAPYAAQNKILDPGSDAAIYVNEVGQVAADTALAQRDPGLGTTDSPRYYPERARLDAVADRPEPLHGYHFILVDDPAPNAWGLPGGFVVVTTGMVTRAGSEEQLAGVLAHEVAHVQRGHGVEIVKQQMCADKDNPVLQLTSGFGKELTAGAKGIQDAGKRFGTSAFDRLDPSKLVELLNKFGQGLVDQVTKSGYGFSYEYEADAFGTRFLAGSGYSSLGIADMLYRVSTDPAIGSAQSKTHPAPRARADLIVKQVGDEKLPPRSSDEALRSARFVQTMGLAKLPLVEEKAPTPSS